MNIHYIQETVLPSQPTLSYLTIQSPLFIFQSPLLLLAPFRSEENEAQRVK